jgi:hypothetical protein
MTKLLSVATASLHPGQLLDIDHVRFHRVNYIELQHLRDVETHLHSEIYLATINWWRSLSHPLVFVPSLIPHDSGFRFPEI